MPRHAARFWIMALSLLLLLHLPSLVMAQNRVRAKLGIRTQSAGNLAWAKAKDTLKAGDFMRVYVIPEQDAYIYLVYTDNKAPTLLNANTYKKKVDKGSVAIFPSEHEYYQTDGANPNESFTIVCSPNEIQEISTLLSSKDTSQAKWAALEEDLAKKSKIVMGNSPDKPFTIAGNVRGFKEEKTESLVNELLTFSGENFLVKKYEFSIKK